jgi:tRNA-dihydrouridine synthase B
MTLKIGSLCVDGQVLLAPMSGVSDLPFRRLVKGLGAPYVVSEMIASEAMIRKTRQSLRMTRGGAETFPMAVQIAGYTPAVMAEAAKLAVDCGAHVIDINMGCPVKKIVNNDSGSALMRDEKHAARIIDAVVKAVPVPVTLKMRKGWDDHSQNAPGLGKIAEELGVQMLTVHGRTRCQLYRGKADWPFFKKVKEAVTIPVIGNGDVLTPQDAKTLLEVGGVDGVMIGRGCYGKPWLIRNTDQYLKTGTLPPPPTLSEQHKIVNTHVNDMLDFYGKEHGVKVARKHLGWYSKGLPSGSQFRVLVHQSESDKDLLRLIDRFYNEQQAP